MNVTAKRSDLQGLRGFAIVAVLGFHFYPEIVPNGYLGVDQFFVLSGFLMCMLLKRVETQPTCTLITLFYSKRFKRILPLYLFTILLSMISLYSVFPDTIAEFNKNSALGALLFVSNTAKSKEDDYFVQLTKAMDIFTHTWSLSVEVQFYFLVPVVFLVALRLPEKLQVGFYIVLGICSYAFFYISQDFIAFNNVFARIWQFLVGMIVYTIGLPNPQYQVINQDIEECENLIDSEEVPETPCNMYSYFLLLGLFTVAAFPLKLHPLIVRPLVTVGTGSFILISEGNFLVSNKLISYIGDISYALYLLHWPIYSYWKLNWVQYDQLLIFVLLSSIILAVIVHETFEKWYLNLSSTSVGLLVVLLFASNVILIEKDKFLPPVDRFTWNNMTPEEANHQWNLRDQGNLHVPYCRYERGGPFGWCNHTGLAGKYKIVVIGNSWTANQGSIIHEECGNKASGILQGSIPTCEILYPTQDNLACKQYYDSFVERIQQETPDYLFLVSRYISVGDPFPANVTSFEEDPVYQIMKWQMLRLSSSTKKRIFILDAVPRVNTKLIDRIASWVKDGVDPVEIDNRLGQSKDNLIDPETYQLARKRYAELVKDFKGRCTLIDFNPEFYNNSTGTFRLFDSKGFSYYTSGMHLTPHGLEHIRHVWRDVCRKIE
ncbi:Acyl_transf_3 domain-containing protein [Caenorhabditis elegans]|uniref:Acyl_transf_3 domain-containing protein n=1 Tax=Caenorhabditis elegans TaxID=6239 RepID=O17749_CAEEL|nr:Acyl_transf_3 domain-containing protein [Caenorhabditis elegans]CAB04031.2 Acyl_transf_3 domain-containing protein [Caenorhabditis elegans]|eukprot:NP_493150.2 O-ACyltransferase homolog [Caenorhabditis elegans]